MTWVNIYEILIIYPDTYNKLWTIVVFSVNLIISVGWVGQIIAISIVRKLKPSEVKRFAQDRVKLQSSLLDPSFQFSDIVAGGWGVAEVGQFFSEFGHLGFIWGRGFQFLLHPNPGQNVFGYPEFCLNLIKCQWIWKRTYPALCMINDIHYFLNHLLISQEISHYSQRYLEISYRW